MMPVGFIIVNTPTSLSFPVMILLPFLPISLEVLVGNPFPVPAVPMPMTAPVIIPPAVVKTIIETGNTGTEIRPVPVVMFGKIPAVLPGPPPKAIPEKQVGIDVRDKINVVGIRDNDHIGGVIKPDRRRSVAPAAGIIVVVRSGSRDTALEKQEE